MLSQGTRLGPYEVTRHIGSGGMGEVYRARDTRLNRDVALKVLPEAFARDGQRMARFEREAKLLASLNHPNIAAIYGLEESNPIHLGGLQVQPAPVRALVMELVEGPTLAERIRSGAIPADEALPIARQVADAVEYAHDKNVIHRDLKPANIKVTAEGTVKVLDFGLAKALSDEPTAEDISNSPTLSMAATRQGMILGTAAYMSPEQAKGKSVDRRTDVWAFGAVLYEMLTGKQAFQGEDLTDTLAAVVMKEPALGELPARTPPAVRNLLRRCLEKNAKRRLRDVGEARILLEDILSGVAPPTTERVSAASHKSRQRLPAVVAAFGVVAALVMGAFIYFRPAPTEPQTIRFSVGPPEGASFQPNPHFLTISPDGTKLAFIAVDFSGKNQLWVRALDSEAAQVLPGTENDPIQPFWSADSRFLAFYAPDRKLKKIAVSGGPVQTITEATSGANGSWNRDGVILFAPATEEGEPRAARPGATIRRVSAAGGASTQVTTLDESRQETAHYWPQFLPDGRHFLYLAVSSNPENSAIFVGTVDSPEKKLLLNALSNVVYVPPGYLLFNREGTLMAQRFDVKRLELTGEEAPIAEDVQFNAVNTRAAFAASANGLLAYRTSTGAASTQLMWFDRTGKELGKLGDPAVHFDVALSSDGKRVSTSIRDPTRQTADLWIYDVERGVPTRFTYDPADENASVWSPDGASVVFNSRRKGHLDLYQKAFAGSDTEHVLVEDNTQKVPRSWSSDGRFILYRSTGAATRQDLFVLPLFDDRKPVPFLQTPFSESVGQFSPDGRWIAYGSDESGEIEVYVAPFPGPGGKVRVSTAGGNWPRWRRDGTEVFYRDLDNRLMAATVNGRAGTFEVSAVGPLFQTRAAAGSYMYDVTADGQRFLINTLPDQAASPPITVVLNWAAGLQR